MAELRVVTCDGCGAVAPDDFNTIFPAAGWLVVREGPSWQHDDMIACSTVCLEIIAGRRNGLSVSEIEAHERKRARRQSVNRVQHEAAMEAIRAGLSHKLVLTAREVQVYASVSEHQYRKWLREGTIAPLPGRTWRTFSRESIDALVKTAERPASDGDLSKA